MRIWYEGDVIGTQNGGGTTQHNGLSEVRTWYGQRNKSHDDKQTNIQKKIELGFGGW